MRITIFSLLFLSFVTSQAHAQITTPIDSVLAHLGMVLGADEKIIDRIDTNKLCRAELDGDIYDRHFYKILNYQHSFKVKAKCGISVSWLLVGVDERKIVRFIFVLSKEKSGQISKLLGAPKLISMLPGILVNSTELRSWEFPAYNALLYSSVADGTEHTLIIYKGDAKALFKL